MIHIWHWLLIVTGTHITNGVYSSAYNFWSGFGSDLAEFGILGGLITAYRHHNCHVKTCPRLGKHPVNGTPYKVCAKHHPALSGGDITHADIIKAYNKENQDV